MHKVRNFEVEAAEKLEARDKPSIEHVPKREFRFVQPFFQPSLTNVPQQVERAPAQLHCRVPSLEQELQPLEQDVDVLQNQPELKSYSEVSVRVWAVPDTVTQQPEVEEQLPASWVRVPRPEPLRDVVDEEHKPHWKVPGLVDSLVQPCDKFNMQLQPLA